MNLDQIAELAKAGRKLDSSQQWQLADALAKLNPLTITHVAGKSGRNENTLLQYARAAQRWPVHDRVEGVSFSAHRVALSWHDPRALLVALKAKYGSPTVSQVRQEMGLEGHPAIELIRKGIRKLDDTIKVTTLTQIGVELELAIGKLRKPAAPLPEVDTSLVEEYVDEEEQEYVDEEEQEYVEPEAKRWTPPVRTADIAGM